jgi:4-amino-4-deoxy-L-arabinose transferase-like glycosyltransferase
MSEQSFNRFIGVSFTLLFFVFFGCMVVIDLMNLDASQYALISKEMFLSGSYLEVYCRDADFLDKPPLLFWLACLSFKVFGLYDWAYRLPSFLILLLGIYSLFRFSRLYYDLRTSKLAALIMASSVAAYCMVTDVRTDTNLTGWVMFSIWQLAEFNLKLRFKNILLGAVGIGMAMLSKGPIGLVVPVVAFSCDFIYKKQWKHFFRWQYLPALVVIALILLPMSYGLYTQYDLHPEKEVYGLHGPSGLRFYFWTQSFGRITGENYWDNHPDPFFLYHSFLWSFLPWTVFFIPAYYRELREKIKSFRFTAKPEVIVISGFTLILFLLSRSKYQLPHYTFLIHPLAALITAKYLSAQLFDKQGIRAFNVVRGFQYFSLALVFIVCFLIMLYVFPAPFLYSLPILISLAFCFYLVVSKKIQMFHKTVTVSLVTMLTAYLVLSGRFYKELLKYQSDWPLATYINGQSPRDIKIIEYQTSCGYAFDFYCNRPVKHIFADISKELVKNKTFIILEKDHLADCFKKYPGVSVIKIYDDFSVTQLTPEFLNPKTRATTMRTKYLLKY